MANERMERPYLARRDSPVKEGRSSSTARIFGGWVSCVSNRWAGSAGDAARWRRTGSDDWVARGCVCERVSDFKWRRETVRKSSVDGTRKPK